MHFTSEQRLDDGVLERRFLLGGIPGILWTHGSEPSPLLLFGHPGGLDERYPRLSRRARFYATGYGFAAAAIELPGGGDRPRLPELEAARADLRRAMAAGEPVDEIVDRLVIPLVDAAEPESRAAIDALLELPEISGPVGCDGGVFALGLRLAANEPRVAASVLFAGTFVPEAIIKEARDITIPVHVLLQWDDAGGNRDQALRVFDAIGSREKTLHANTGGHTGVPEFEFDAVAAFFTRHLR